MKKLTGKEIIEILEKTGMSVSDFAYNEYPIPTDFKFSDAIIEMIFMIDGIGKMAMDAILMRDYPVVQAYVVWTALIFTCVNLVTDLLLHQLEPQARQFTKGGGW